MWSTVLAELEKLYPTHACAEFLRCYPLFGFRPDEVGPVPPLQLSRADVLGSLPFLQLILPHAYALPQVAGAAAQRRDKTSSLLEDDSSM